MLSEAKYLLDYHWEDRSFGCAQDDGAGGTKFVEARRAGSDDGAGGAERNHRAVMLIGAWMHLIRATQEQLPSLSKYLLHYLWKGSFKFHQSEDGSSD